MSLFDKPEEEKVEVSSFLNDEDFKPSIFDEESKVQNEIKVVDEPEIVTPSNVEDIRLKKVYEDTQFSKTMDKAKESVLADAVVNDDTFVEEVKDEIKEAAKTSAKTERKKEKLKETQVDTETKQEQRRQEQVKHGINEDKWSNIEKKRLYCYNGVKPIMLFVNITEPMNVVLTTILTVLLFIPFLIDKLLKATLGALLAGAADGNRSKSVQGFLWTLLATLVVLIISVLIYLFLKWQCII